MSVEDRSVEAEVKAVAAKAADREVSKGLNGIIKRYAPSGTAVPKPLATRIRLAVDTIRSMS